MGKRVSQPSLCSTCLTFTKTVISGSSEIFGELAPIICAVSKIRLVDEKLFSRTQMIFDPTKSIFYMAENIAFVQAS